MEQYDRLIKLIGEVKTKKLQSNTILIIGLGGVGGYVVESLVRCGIKRFFIADFDKFEITNSNRQLHSLKNTLNDFKVDVIKDRIKEIDESIEVVTFKEKLTKENIVNLFNEKIDFVVDACDDIEVKKEIIKITSNKDIKLISSMGTANKLDGTKFEITTLNKTTYDPIAKILRKFVKEEKINKKIPVISSIEKPKNNNMGTISYVPAIAGLLCTNYVVNEILKED